MNAYLVKNIQTYVRIPTGERLARIIEELAKLYVLRTYVSLSGREIIIKGTAEKAPELIHIIVIFKTERELKEFMKGIQP